MKKFYLLPYLKKMKRPLSKVKNICLCLLEIVKVKRLYRYFNSKYGYVIKKYMNVDVPLASADDDYVVWVMWWQGEEQMPDIIKICYHSLKKHANGHQINLITKENYKDYVKLPEFILDKVEQKIISITHLADILRVCLLSEYGGLWLDATIFLSADLPKAINACFWTTRWKLKPKDFFKYKLWVGLWAVSSVQTLSVQQCIGIMYSSKQNHIFLCLKEFWFEYWKYEKKIHYYFTLELFLTSMYDKIPAIKKIIDNVPYSNPDVFDLSELVNKKYNDKIINKCTQNTQFFFLTWKYKYSEIDQETGEETLYGFLKRNGTVLCSCNGA